MYMKRLNPKTNEPFKRGDIREDGRVFYNYLSRVKADGYFSERWLSPESSERAKKSDRDHKNKTRVRLSDRLPRNHKKALKHDPSLIAIFKTAWKQKYDGKHTDEDLVETYDAFPEILALLLPEHVK